jgi:hypothetical protein
MPPITNQIWPFGHESPVVAIHERTAAPKGLVEQRCRLMSMIFTTL